MSKDTKSDLNTIIADAAPKRRWKAKTAIAASVLCVALAVWFTQSKSAAANATGPSYVTEPLARGSVSLSITATGSLQPTNEVTVGSELSGIMLEVYVDVNDRIKKGQPLAKLDPTTHEQQLQSSQASLLSAKANLAQAKATYKENQANLARLQNLRKLSGGKLPSAAEMDSVTAAAERAEASVQVAEAAVGEAEARVQINKSDLEKAVIRSPIDGIVLTRAVEPGQTVAASFQAPELFVIAESLEQMKLLVNVAEADIARLSEGQQARFTVDAWPNRTYQATVRRVSFGSLVTNNVVTYETELEVSNDDLSLRPGMTATADISVAQSQNVFVVPTAALRFKPQIASATHAVEKKSFVQSLTPMPPRQRMGSRSDASSEPATRVSQIWLLQDGQPTPIDVTIGISDGRKTEVAAAQLSEGQPIILRSQS